MTPEKEIELMRQLMKETNQRELLEKKANDYEATIRRRPDISNAGFFFALVLMVVLGFVIGFAAGSH